MLTATDKQKLDEAAEFARFKTSPLYRVLRTILAEYRESAIAELEAQTRGEVQTEPIRRLLAANDLVRHIDVAIASRLDLIDEVARTHGIDLDELLIRRDIEDE